MYAPPALSVGTRATRYSGARELALRKGTASPAPPRFTVPLRDDELDADRGSRRPTFQRSRRRGFASHARLALRGSEIRARAAAGTRAACENWRRVARAKGPRPRVRACVRVRNSPVLAEPRACPRRKHIRSTSEDATQRICHRNAFCVNLVAGLPTSGWSRNPANEPQSLPLAIMGDLVSSFPCRASRPCCC